jgi:hypothetical protein
VCPALAATSLGEAPAAIHSDHVRIGIDNPDLTLEDVRDHFDDFRDETGYSVPSGVADEIASLVGRLR